MGIRCSEVRGGEAVVRGSTVRLIVVVVFTVMVLYYVGIRCSEVCEGDAVVGGSSVRLILGVVCRVYCDGSLLGGYRGYVHGYVMGVEVGWS